MFNREQERTELLTEIQKLGYDSLRFSIFVGERYGASLNGGKSMVAFDEIKDWDSYLKEIMAEIELHIPDKFLKAKGWL